MWKSNTAICFITHQNRLQNRNNQPKSKSQANIDATHHIMIQDRFQNRNHQPESKQSYNIDATHQTMTWGRTLLLYSVHSSTYFRPEELADIETTSQHWGSTHQYSANFEHCFYIPYAANQVSELKQPAKIETTSQSWANILHHDVKVENYCHIQHTEKQQNQNNQIRDSDWKQTQSIKIKCLFWLPVA